MRWGGRGGERGKGVIFMKRGGFLFFDFSRLMFEVYIKILLNMNHARRIYFKVVLECVVVVRVEKEGVLFL